jgi:hypothetical protein
MGVSESVEVAGPEDPAQDADGKEEAGLALDPGTTVGSEPPGGHDAVQVRMMDEGLPPGVEDGEEADAGAEEARVGSDIEQRG